MWNSNRLNKPFELMIKNFKQILLDIGRKFMIHVKVSAPVYPTEDPEKVIMSDFGAVY